MFFFFFSSRRRHTRWTGDWSSDVCSSDLDSNSLRIINIAPSARASALMAKTVPSIEFFLMSRPGLVAAAKDTHAELQRSEERRVGKECRARWSWYHYKKNRLKD